METKSKANTRQSVFSKIKYPSLRRYIQVMESIESTNLTNLSDLKDQAQIRAGQDLLEAGLVSKPSILVGGSSVSKGIMCLTPAGALALVEWQDYVERKSIRGRSIGFLVQLFTLTIAAFLGANL